MKVEKIPFIFVGNNLAVDFVNTEVAPGGNRISLLENSDDLQKWAEEAKLKIEELPSKAVFTKALSLRGALRETIEAKIDGRQAKAANVTTINEHLADYSIQLTLVSDKGRYELQEVTESLTPLDLLNNIAYAGSAMLACPKGPHLKRCSNPNCILLFLDTSKNHKRRWCSMEACGNRAKVSTHYRKNQSA